VANASSHIEEPYSQREESVRGVSSARARARARASASGSGSGRSNKCDKAKRKEAKRDEEAAQKRDEEAAQRGLRVGTAGSG